MSMIYWRSLWIWKQWQFYPQAFDRQMTQVWIERNLQRYAQHGFAL